MEKRINKIYIYIYNCITCTMTMVKDKDQMVVDAAGNVHHGPTCMYISFKTKTCKIFKKVGGGVI